MIRVADYIAQFLADRGVQHCFMVTGGGAMHLNDAFGREKRIGVVCCHHEQACSMAADSYVRLSGRVAVVNVTTGPGGTNAITGVWGAYMDSLAMIVISGQVKWQTLVPSTGLPLRQLGDQEAEIVKIVQPMTKYAHLVRDPQSVRYHLEKAFHIATTGRRGPVWIDVPMDVQGAKIDPAQLKGYNPAEDQVKYATQDLSAAARDVLRKLKEAKRPVILAGSGVRLSGAYQEFLQVVEKLEIPVVTAWNAHDLIWDDHPLYAGRPGTIGDRPGNYAVQSSDFLLILGARLSIRQISYAWDYFARGAYKVMVDVDDAEMKKPTLKIDYRIHADLKDFLPAMLAQPLEGPTKEQREYLEWCQVRRKKYPVVLPEYRELKGIVNPYVFMDRLFAQLPEDECIVTANGTACTVGFQAATIKKGQRLFTNNGSAPMGYDLPGAIGASIALGKKTLVCLAGDGSIQMNLQELQTIVTHRLPIKIFLLNNQGYHSIRQTMRNFFPDNVFGCGDSGGGLDFPDFGKLANAYGIPFRRVRDHAELDGAIRETLRGDGYQMCEVMLDIRQPFAPKVSSKRLPDGRMVSAPLEDMAPFLPREEMLQNLLIPPVSTE